MATKIKALREKIMLRNLIFFRIKDSGEKGVNQSEVSSDYRNAWKIILKTKHSFGTYHLIRRIRVTKREMKKIVLMLARDPGHLSQ